MNTIKATSNDKIIFTSLKPMSELNLSIPVLLYDSQNQPHLGMLYEMGIIIMDTGFVKADMFIGWHYVPVFNPDWAGCMEELGADFQQVLNENMHRLYEE